MSLFWQHELTLWLLRTDRGCCGADTWTTTHTDSVYGTLVEVEFSSVVVRCRNSEIHCRRKDTRTRIRCWSWTFSTRSLEIFL